MIGAWSTLGIHTPPIDGEMIVFLAPFGPKLSDGIEPVTGQLIPAIYRYGSVLTQDGVVCPLQPGTEWTTLPFPSFKAPR